MAKGDFICTNCKEVGSASDSMYQCAKHKKLCRDCVSASGFFTTKYTCKKCGTGVLRFEYDDKKNKWAQI